MAQDREGFHRIDKGGTAPVTEDRLIPDQRGTYSVSASAEQQSDDGNIALGQVLMRQDVSVKGDERWASV